jgi:glucose/arabinose dehydrogenase
VEFVSGGLLDENSSRDSVIRHCFGLGEEIWFNFPLMKATLLFPACLLFASAASSQDFTRSELPTPLNNPWEITFGPDGYLWITEEGGKVVRVHPQTGDKTTVYTAPDYSKGHPSECCQYCYNPDIGKGTLGLALHPDFMDASTAYIYYVYSYNNGTDSLHNTRFKIRRLTWDHNSKTVTAATDVVKEIPSGYDHLGGRLMAVKQNNTPYLYLSVGDNGISETNFPGCYDPDSLNPNNKCQNPAYKSGKIHRFNMDGSIPADNPLQGNSFFTRGHRNPQGLAFNAAKNVLYDVEHGDRTDDEVNVLKKGMNYGWKNVRGYHADGNHVGEDTYIANYVPYPGISGDALVEPLYAWCAATQPTVSDNSEWGTVAPSDAVYYGTNGIPDFDNSLLVVTLKKGKHSNREVYRLRLNSEGTGLAPSTVADPNPKKYFGNDQDLNGRLRDIAVSPDLRTIYLINNTGADRDKITMYTYNGPLAVKQEAAKDLKLELFPNPCRDNLNIDCSEKLDNVEVFNVLGQKQQVFITPTGLNISMLPPGTYSLRLYTVSGQTGVQRLVKE